MLLFLIGKLLKKVRITGSLTLPVLHIVHLPVHNYPQPSILTTIDVIKERKCPVHYPTSLITIKRVYDQHGVWPSSHAHYTPSRSQLFTALHPNKTIDVINDRKSPAHYPTCLITIMYILCTLYTFPVTTIHSSPPPNKTANVRVIMICINKKSTAKDKTKRNNQYYRLKLYH